MHLNIMLQNIDRIEGQDIAQLKRFGKVTATTAHEAYSDAKTRDSLGVALHKLASTLCNTDRFGDDLRAFYRGEYTFP